MWILIKHKSWKRGGISKLKREAISDFEDGGKDPGARDKEISGIGFSLENPESTVFANSI